jgi:hypothetical protein
MIQYLFGGLRTYLKAKELSLSKNKQKSATVSALKKALRSTKKHIESNPSKEMIDAKTSDLESEELAELWSKAAELIRPYNPGVAQRFEDKSDYWTNPKLFRQDIKDAKRKRDFRMHIDEVEKLINAIEEDWKKL